MFTASALLTSFCYIIELAPYHMIAYYPYRDRLRYPAWSLFTMIGANLFIKFFVVSYFYSTGRDIRALDLVFSGISLLCYIICVKIELSKLLFIYVLILDYIMIVRGIAIFLAFRLYMDPGTQYRFLSAPVDSFIRLIPFLVTAPFVLPFLDQVKERVLRTNAPQLWRTIWLVPALNTVIVLLLTWNVNIASIRGLSFLLARVSLLIVGIAVYYLLVCSLESVQAQYKAEERSRNQEHIIALQRLQYSRLQKQIEKTRQARHDLRQHLNLIQAYLNKGDNEALQDYITKYGKSLPLNTWKAYCANYAVDTVVRYYADQAEASGIRFDCQILLSRDLAVDEPSICVLLGNLLENAIEACASCGSPSPFISIHARSADEKAISITVDNTCSQPPAKDENGRLLSAKHSGLGTGILSVRNIASQYHGIVDFKFENGIFYASVFLNP